VRLAAAAAIALLAGSASAAPDLPRLELTQFFNGRSHADNMLKIAFHGPTKLIVDSVGGKGDRGDFVLIDTVHEGDKPVRTRKWVMRPAGPNHFTGALSDAIGPVDIVVSGDSATIRYTMKGGLSVVQQMRLQTDGRTLSNHVEARKFGLKFARVDGTIRKLD
jgi:uncharacterized protein DUF3833